MGLKDFFVKDIETRDIHPNQDLRTHYYKTEYRDAKDAVLRYLNKNKMKVSNVDDNYGEILVEESSYHMIVSIRKANILQVSIDVKVSVYALVGAYKPHKIIREFYSKVDKELPFIGVGLQP